MNAIPFSGNDQADQPTAWLTRKIAPGITPAVILLALIILLSAGLHLANLDAIGEANTYYTAAVKSMLQSWHNFFFVAAEPGGSVTVDKPPLGLWIEAAFALVLGVNGLAVSLPNILAGILSVALMYYLVKKHLGPAAGLAAALVMAVTPVVYAADRNNTMDGMLNLALLLAAWAFLRATETGKLRFLLLGAFIVGLGFNIKMLQAFLPLPALYALYFFGGSAPWGRKIVHLLAATLVLAPVSLSWALVVDSIPADQRPYIGSSTDNTVMELIVGHNGLNRLTGDPRPGGEAQTGPAALDGSAQQPPDGFPGRTQDGRGPAFQDAPEGFSRPAGDGGFNGGANPGGGMGMTSGETGQAGWLRFFQAPLAKEMSWLLPL
ncbi:MAG: phospholipid carrier-dependent glycosyltransferase, partial [Chloroflexi bacterium]|nr:phospholipid carrier-dependent glycosyltransferase [Chloroflexota bacterium]